MKQFLMLLRGFEKFEELSTEEKNSLFPKYGEFFSMLEKEAKLTNGFRVKNPIHEISSNDNRIINKEINDKSNRINGHFIISAENIEKAIELVKECPSLKYGEKIELIEIC